MSAKTLHALLLINDKNGIHPQPGIRLGNLSYRPCETLYLNIRKIFVYQAEYAYLCCMRCTSHAVRDAHLNTREMCISCILESSLFAMQKPAFS